MQEEGEIQDENKTPDERNVMDNLLSKLKNAGPNKTDSSTARSRAKARKDLLEKGQLSTPTKNTDDGDDDSTKMHTRSSSTILDNLVDLKHDSGSNSSIIYSPDTKDKLRKEGNEKSPNKNNNDGLSAQSLLNGLRTEGNSVRTEEERRKLRELHKKNKKESNRLQFFEEPTKEE